MTRLTGDAVRLHLIRNRDGKTNWAGLRRAQSAGADSPSGVPVSGWHLEYFSINDLQLTYDDLATGTRLKTAEFDVSSDTLHGRRPLQFRAEVARFALEVDMRKRLAAVKDVRLTALGVTLTGACTVERLADDPRYRGELMVEEFSPRELLAALGVSPPDTRDRSVLATAALHLPFRGERRSSLYGRSQGVLTRRVSRAKSASRGSPSRRSVSTCDWTPSMSTATAPPPVTRRPVATRAPPSSASPGKSSPTWTSSATFASAR